MSSAQEFASLTLNAASSQLRMGNPDLGGATITLSAAVPSASRIYTIPDAGQDSKFYMSMRPVVAITTTAALTAAQSGSLITVSSATAYTVTLPAVATSSGVSYDIVKLNATANAVQVSALTAVMQGTIDFADAGTGANGTLVAAKTNLVFIATALAGDRIHLDCDGVNWYVTAFSGTTLGITTS